MIVTRYIFVIIHAENIENKKHHQPKKIFYFILFV